MQNIIKNKLKLLKKSLIEIKIKVANRCIKHAKIEDLKLYMTILAKNEDDIIEENIIFHKAMGVDGFIVTDNNSSDRTREIFEKYKEIGWIKEIIEETGEDHSQIAWVDQMIKLAKGKYNADWVINSDADEFWYSKNGNLKTSLRKSNTNKIMCNIYNMLPIKDAKFYESTNMVKKYISNNYEYQLSKFNMFTVQIPKVIHRTNGYKKIHAGNHNVDMKLASQEISKDIIILHYSIRGLEHFKNKMINGGAALEKNLKLDKDSGGHWRYYYEGWKKGIIDLDEEYIKYIGKGHIDIFKTRGIIEENDFVKNFFIKEVKSR